MTKFGDAQYYKTHTQVKMAKVSNVPTRPVGNYMGEPLNKLK